MPVLSAFTEAAPGRIEVLLHDGRKRAGEGRRSAFPASVWVYTTTAPKRSERPLRSPVAACLTYTREETIWIRRELRSMD